MDKRIKRGDNVNKTNVNEIIAEATLFTIYTKWGDKFPNINQDKLKFLTDKLIQIPIGYEKYAYIDIGSVIRIDTTK